MSGGFASMTALLRHRAETQGGDRAYAFLADRGGGAALDLDFASLDRRARALAARLCAEGAEAGDRVLLVFPPGLDFIVAWFACLFAGAAAVPMMPPRRRRLRDSSDSIIADCAPRLALTTEAALEGLREQLCGAAAGLRWLAVDAGAETGVEADAPLDPGRDDIAFLQYTSGSTSAPKGVMVSHGNLLDNLEMIRRALGNSRTSTHVSWVPLYHDMGLILNVLQTLYLGAPCVLMAPAAFMQRPLNWLRAISDYRAEVAGAPNFAFDLCVERFRADQLEGLDLSGWKVAFNGAEPVRAETLDRFAATFAPYGFRAEALYPCYGMAEATLLISGGRRGGGATVRRVSREALRRHRIEPPAAGEDTQALVGCGRVLEGERIAIVEPESRRRLPAGQVGEIWVAGRNVTAGYWRKPDASAAALRARIAGEGPPEHGLPGWLRTGDLGVMDEDGEIYVTGRIKDVIIVRGANFYPQDIERVVEASHPALRRHCCAAFTIAGPGGERLVVVQEVERTARHHLDLDDITGAIREAVVREFELAIHKIVLIRTGSIPKTTSGKIQRNLTRQRWLDATLEIWGDDEAPAAAERECASPPAS